VEKFYRTAPNRANNADAGLGGRLAASNAKLDKLFKTLPSLTPLLDQSPEDSDVVPCSCRSIAARHDDANGHRLYRFGRGVLPQRRLEIPDLLENGPRTIKDLAKATHSNEDALYRTMRALAGVGIFKETSSRVLELTPAAETRRTGAPDSLRDACCGSRTRFISRFMRNCRTRLKRETRLRNV
jgi:hypothetical protein